MKIIDISWPTSNNMVTYKNKSDVKITQTRNFAEHGMRESQITCGTHTGTHIDAPAHFLEDGGSVSTISLAKLIGECVVLDMTHVSEKITAGDLQGSNLQGCKKVLLKTKNSAESATGDFDLNFIYLDVSGAQFLAEQNVDLVGIDSLGIERNQPDHETHKLLFNSGAAILEGLRLQDVVAGKYKLTCLPLKLDECEGAPARAVLTIDY